MALTLVQGAGARPSFLISKTKIMTHCLFSSELWNTYVCQEPHRLWFCISIMRKLKPSEIRPLANGHSVRVGLPETKAGTFQLHRAVLRVCCSPKWPVPVHFVPGPWMKPAHAVHLLIPAIVPFSVSLEPEKEDPQKKRNQWPRLEWRFHLDPLHFISQWTNQKESPGGDAASKINL